MIPILTSFILSVSQHISIELLWLYATRLTAIMVQTLAMFVVAKLVGVGDFGRFSFIFSASQVFSVILSLGGPQFLLRLLPSIEVKNGGAGSYFIIKRAYQRTLVSITVLFAIYFAISQVGIDWTHMVVSETDSLFILIIASSLSILSITVSIVRVSRSATLTMFLKDVVVYLILILACIGLYFYNITLYSVIILYTVSIVIAISISMFVVLGYLRSMRRIDINNIKHPSEYFAFFGSSIVGAIFAQFDVLIAKFLFNDTELGSYVLLRKISNLISLPLVIVNTLYNTKIARCFALGNRQELAALAKSCLDSSLPFALLLVFGISAACPIWLEYFGVGKTYSVLATLLILMAGQVVNVLSGANLLFSSQCGEELYVFKVRILSLVTGCAIIVFGAHFLDWAALPLGVIVSTLTLNVFVTYHVKRKIGVWTCARFIRF